MEVPNTPDPSVVADATAASADATVEAVDRAAEANQDPEVAEILQDASLKANTTASRAGWLRSWFARLFRRD
jgi:hypothetical protein